MESESTLNDFNSILEVLTAVNFAFSVIKSVRDSYRDQLYEELTDWSSSKKDEIDRLEVEILSVYDSNISNSKNLKEIAYIFLVNLFKKILYKLQTDINIRKVKIAEKTEKNIKHETEYLFTYFGLYAFILLFVSASKFTFFDKSELLLYLTVNACCSIILSFHFFRSKIKTGLILTLVFSFIIQLFSVIYSKFNFTGLSLSNRFYFLYVINLLALVTCFVPSFLKKWKPTAIIFIIINVISFCIIYLWNPPNLNFEKISFFTFLFSTLLPASSLFFLYFKPVAAKSYFTLRLLFVDNVFFGILNFLKPKITNDDLLNQISDLDKSI